MTYKIENRYGEFFAITDKTYNDQIITVNLSSIVLTDTITLLKTIPIKEEFVWILSYNKDNNQLYMKLITEKITFQKKININTVIDELINCIIQNRTLNNCIYINEIINDLYNNAFDFYFRNETVLLSNHIIKKIAYTNDLNNMVVGCSSRFILNSTSFYLLEYEGKIKDADEFKYIEIICEDKKIQFLKSKVDESYYQSIGYYKISGLLGQMLKVDTQKKEIVDIDQIVKLKLKNKFTTLEDIKDYTLNFNSLQDILEYKKSMRPSIVLIDINKYILQEFMI